MNKTMNSFTAHMIQSVTCMLLAQLAFYQAKFYLHC